MENIFQCFNFKYLFCNWVWYMNLYKEEWCDMIIYDMICYIMWCFGCFCKIYIVYRFSQCWLSSEIDSLFMNRSSNGKNKHLSSPSNSLCSISKWWKLDLQKFEWRLFFALTYWNVVFTTIILTAIGGNSHNRDKMMPQSRNPDNISESKGESQCQGGVKAYSWQFVWVLQLVCHWF